MLFILECECGRAATVGLPWAGKRLSCGCGGSIEVPPPSAFRRLGALPAEEPKAASGVALSQILIGAAAAVAFGFAAVLG